jgi:hypothetical protein
MLSLTFRVLRFSNYKFRGDFFYCGVLRFSCAALRIPGKNFFNLDSEGIEGV